MSVRSKHKSVKSEEEGNSWFGRIKNVFYTNNSVQSPKQQRRTYQTTSEDQILKMFEKRKQHPTLSVSEIGKIIGVSEAVCQYWLEQKESDVLANIKAKKGRRKADQERRERVRITEEKREKKRLRKLKKKAKSAKPKQPTVTFASPETEKEISLSTFAQLSNREGEKILNKIEQEDKYPTRQKASPKWKGALPIQIVATEEEWKIEDRNYKIGKATMHKAIVTKQEADTQSKKEEQTNAKSKIMHEKGLRLDGKPLKLHIQDKCPSCNPNSKLTLKEYQTIVFHVFKEMKDFAIENDNMKKQNDKTKKQLDKRAQQLVELEKESLGNVADRVKEGTHICEVCESSLSYPQATRSSSRNEGHYFCADHDPKDKK